VAFEDDEDLGEDPTFQPLRPARGIRLLVAVILGPIAWVIAWLIAAYLIHKTDAIEFGLLVTVAAFVAAMPTLALLTARRRWEERRYERRA